MASVCTHDSVGNIDLEQVTMTRLIRDIIECCGDTWPWSSPPGKCIFCALAGPLWKMRFHTLFHLENSLSEPPNSVQRSPSLENFPDILPSPNPVSSEPCIKLLVCLSSSIFFDYILHGNLYWNHKN